MSVITAAVYGRLAGDAQLIALLATYRGGPAIFTTDPAPGDAALPYIVTAGDVSNEPDDTKDSRGRFVRRDVRCYTAATGSAVLVERIAERVRGLLHRQNLTVDGHTVVISQASGPFTGPDEDDAYGRIVTLTLTMEEQ